MRRLLFLCVPVFVLFAQEARSACVTLTWTAVGNDRTDGPALKYEIRYSESMLTEDNWMSAHNVLYVPDPLPAGYRHWFNIGGLKPYTTYYMAVRVADDRVTWSSLSNVVTKQAQGTPCLGEVGNVDCDPNDRVDGSDLAVLASFLFNRAAVCCDAEANLSRDPEGHIDTTDLGILISFLFSPPGAYQLPACPGGQ